jgi:hypothetical protein
MTKQVEIPGIHNARRGNALHKYVNDKTASGSLQVLTDATLVYNIPEGEQVLVTMMHYDLETVSDDCQYEVVATDAVDGGGTATTLCGHSHLFVGTGNNPAADRWRPFVPPMCIKYSAGYRSVTMRINANDSAAVIGCGWMGWHEKEV